MYLRLLKLEWLSFFRNPQFGTTLGLKLLTYFGLFYFSLIFAALSFVLYYFAIEELHVDPIRLFSKFFIYYWVVDLVLRFIMQPMPTQNIKPFLTIGMTKNSLVKYSILKVFFHYFNWAGLIFLLPFAGLLIFSGGYSVVPVLLFVVGITAMFYINNFLNILLNGKDVVFYGVAIVFAVLAALDYYQVIQLSTLSEHVFYGFYKHPFLVAVPIVVMLFLVYAAYRMIYQQFYLDKGLEVKKEVGRTENIEYLNRFGTVGTFLNNDIRMIKRTKAARTAFFMSILFVAYGLIGLTGQYQSPYGRFFLALFISGGFMFMFGQRVPSWDSSYYPLMMTQQVPYRDYLKAKWSLLVLGIIVSLVVASFYIFVYDFEFYLTVIAAGLYNVGINSFMTLIAGAFNKIPIDLNSNKKSMGGGQSKFNMRVLLMIIPQMILPIATFALVSWLGGIYAAVITLGCLGVVGLLLRQHFFTYITKVYKTEKYTTLESFKKTT